MYVTILKQHTCKSITFETATIVYNEIINQLSLVLTGVGRTINTYLTDQPSPRLKIRFYLILLNLIKLQSPLHISTTIIKIFFPFKIRNSKKMVSEIFLNYFFCPPKKKFHRKTYYGKNIVIVWFIIQIIQLFL